MFVYFTANVSLEDGPETTSVRFMATKAIPILFRCISKYLGRKEQFQHIEAINN